jgi:hypothetical protein
MTTRSGWRNDEGRTYVTARVPRRGVRAVTTATLVLVWLALPTESTAQGLGGGLRIGAGVDTAGRVAYGVQLELIEFGTSSSFELALHAFGATRVENYEFYYFSTLRQYHEESRLRGLGIIANLLARHARESSGPYLVLGVGLGPLEVDWRVESATDPTMSTPLPNGGSFDAEKRRTVGSLVNLGIGWRIDRRLDLRAQILTALASPTDVREDLKIVPAATLSVGIGY